MGWSGPRFAILLTSNTCEYIIKTYGGLEALYLLLLRDPGETWVTFPVVNGIFPSDEELEEYDGFVVTGSRVDAYGDQKWILELCDLLKKIHERRKKILGICFGHQVLSRALGGRIGRGPAWELGLKTVNVCDALLCKSYGHELPCSFNIIQAHQDQVFEIPSEGEVLAWSENTGIEMFAIGDHVLGIQGHPEFPEDVFKEMMNVCVKEGLMKEELANAAKASLEESRDGEANHDLLQRVCKLFLKGDMDAPPSPTFNIINDPLTTTIMPTTIGITDEPLPTNEILPLL